MFKRISNIITDLFVNLFVWAGSDNFRWSMKTVGLDSWSTRGLKEKPPAEEGAEKEE